MRIVILLMEDYNDNSPEAVVVLVVEPPTVSSMPCLCETCTYAEHLVETKCLLLSRILHRFNLKVITVNS